MVLGVRSRGRTYATRNLHFFAELGVRGTPNIVTKLGVSTPRRPPLPRLRVAGLGWWFQVQIPI